MLLLTPNAQPVEFTLGDTVTLTLIATDDSGNGVNLTGYTLQTQVTGPNGVGPVTFPNAQHTLANQTTNPGQFTLALTSANTASLQEGPNKQILTEGTDASGNITYFRGVNLLTVYPNVPLQ